MDWLRLIRWKNLLIVFFTQLLVWYCLIDYPGDLLVGVTLFDFLPVGASTVLIAAAGYIINDYFDIKIDIINRPEKVVIAKLIPLRAAIIAHVLLNLLALALVYPLATRHGHPEWMLVQAVCIVLLWFYSTHFKRQLLTGNIVVSILAALTVLVLQVYKPELQGVTKVPVLRQAIPAEWILFGYAFFAFMLTWMRETVKDMEDVKGDADQGCKTLPITMGLEFTAQFVRVLGAFTLLILGIASIFVFKRGYVYLGFYTTLGVILPLLWLTFTLGKVNTTAYFAIASRWLKIIMIAGICSLIVYHFSNNYTLETNSTGFPVAPQKAAHGNG